MQTIKTPSIPTSVIAIVLAAAIGVANPPAVIASSSPEIIDVQLHLVRTEVESAEHGWLVAREGSRYLSLDELMSNMNLALGDEPLAPGLYTGLRLILGEGSQVRILDDDLYRDVPLFVPSGGQTGLKMDESFEVVEGKLLQLDVELDATALRYQRPQRRFILRPTCLTIVGFRELDAVASIGPEGGSLTTLDGMVELIVPVDALTSPATFEVRRLPEQETPPPLPADFPALDRIAPVGPAYELHTEPDLDFSVPVTLTMHYTEEEILEIDESLLAVHVYDESSELWKYVPSYLDPDGNFTLAELDHFSTYRLLANANGLVLGGDDRQIVDSGLQQGGGFGPTQHIGSTGRCTGFLISNNLFMTNHHCLVEGWCAQPGTDGASFNRILDPLNSVQAGEPEFFACDGVRLALEALDVAVVELRPDAATGKSAGEIWGYYTLDPSRRAVRAYSAGFPADRVLFPSKLWIDRFPGCGTGFPNPLEAFFWGVDFLHGCDSGPGSDGSPIVDFQDRNRVLGIHHGSRGFLWHRANVGTFMASVIPFDDINGNSVLDMVEIDLTGGLTDVGFRTCVPELDGACILRWFLPYRIEFTGRGGVPPYTWSASGNLPAGATMSSSGVLEGPATFCLLCNHDFQVTLTDSVGASTTRTVRLHSGL